MACGAEGEMEVPSRQPWLMGPALSCAMALPGLFSNMNLRALRQKAW